ncbi:hypothetical protein KW787_03925 [Candidatus Pacearchaeota archaeon]|nr:hypothetical protein [Candidatus Pacearchaeota archaeon]
MSKKGLSDVVTTVLIILLVLAAIAVVWAFLRPALKKGAQSIETESLLASLVIIPNSVVDYTNAKAVAFMVKRETGPGQVVGFDIILEDFDGTRAIFRNYENKSLNEFETASIIILYKGNITSLKKIILAPLVKNPNTGETIEGKAPSNYQVADSQRRLTLCNNIVYPNGEWCCGADINRDRAVTISDFIDFESHFNQNGCESPGWCGNTDLNHDGMVSISDNIDFASHFGQSPCFPPV